VKKIADEVIDVISPVIGKGLATSAVYMQCRKIGIQPGDLSIENLEEFSQHFEKVMQIFAGDEIAHEIVQKIRETGKNNF
jgi:hypothetical protein